MSENRPKIGVGVWIECEGKFLLSRRLGEHGANKWSPPGGHLEYGESPEECAIREAEEECGLALKNVELVSVTNDVFLESERHYITLHMYAQCVTQEYENKEPHKHEMFKWLTWEELNEKDLFLPAKNFVEKDRKPSEF